MKNKVTKESFIRWYFSDPELVEELGYSAFSSLLHEGEFIITAQDVFNDCQYIPRFICVDKGDDDDDTEYDPKSIELIN